MENYHLIHDEDGWKLTVEGSTRPLDVFWTKHEAVSCCEDIIRGRDNGEGSVKVHGADGTVEEERIYPQGSDAVKSRG